jgi:hypothetical protein
VLKICDACNSKSKRGHIRNGVIESAARELLQILAITLAYPMIIKVGRGGVPPRE